MSVIEKQFSAATFRIPNAASALRRRADDRRVGRAALRRGRGLRRRRVDLRRLSAPTGRSRVGGLQPHVQRRDPLPGGGLAVSLPASRRPARAPSSRAGTRRAAISPSTACWRATPLCSTASSRCTTTTGPHSRTTRPPHRRSGLSCEAVQDGPSSSIFGLMLEGRRDYRIVQSDARAFLSHSPFTWLVEGSDFVYDEKLTRGSHAFDRSLDSGCALSSRANASYSSTPCTSCSRARRRRRGLSFRIIWRRTSRRWFKEGRALDAETRSFLLRTIASGVGILTSSTARNMLPDGILDGRGLPRRVGSVASAVRLRFKRASRRAPSASVEEEGKGFHGRSRQLPRRRGGRFHRLGRPVSRGPSACGLGGERRPRGFPIATFSINVVGAFAIGFIVAWATRNAQMSPEMLLLLKAGVCGGFTTFSTFSLESMQLIEAGAWAMAVAYMVLSVGGVFDRGVRRGSSCLDGVRWLLRPLRNAKRPDAEAPGRFSGPAWSFRSSRSSCS